jgi:hypothetical protein
MTPAKRRDGRTGRFTLTLMKGFLVGLLLVLAFAAATPAGAAEGDHFGFPWRAIGS